MSRAEQHSREVIEADRAELIRMIREPIDRGHGDFGDDDYRPPMQAEACLGCGTQLYGGDHPVCAVCGLVTPWRKEYGEILDLERRCSTWRPSDRSALIRESFGISPTTYQQRVARMLDDPRALTVDAVTVRRLIRRRDGARDQRTGQVPPRSARPDARQRPLPLQPSSPASAPTSTPDLQRAEVPAEPRATEAAPDRVAVDVAAAGDATLPDPATSSWASEGGSGEPSEGVRARVENDRVWGRRDRLQRRPRPLGDTLRIVVHVIRELWRGSA